MTVGVVRPDFGGGIDFSSFLGSRQSILGVPPGRPIDWSAEDSKKTLSQLLDTPYEHLFDPKFASPVYAGVPLDFSHSRCHTQADPKIDLRKLYDATDQGRKLVENGLVSNSILKKPSTNLRQFAAQMTDQVAAELQSPDNSPWARLKALNKTFNFGSIGLSILKHRSLWLAAVSLLINMYRRHTKH